MATLTQFTRNHDFATDFRGNTVAYNKSSGEIIDGIEVITPAERDAKAKKYYAQRHNELMRFNTDNLGNFYFAKNDNYADLTAGTLGRLIYLNTFITYKDKRLVKDGGVPIKKEDLGEILRVSESVKRNFINEVMGRYIQETKDGLISISPDMFKGKIKRSDKDSYRKIYIEGVRSLYEKMTTSQHKYLGNICKILPYLNTEYNIICWNPTETDLYAIVPMTMTDLCKELGYKADNTDKFKKAFENIKFEVRGQRESFVTFIKGKIFVNPNVLYSGSDFKKVEVLGLFYHKPPQKSELNW